MADFYRNWREAVFCHERIFFIRYPLKKNHILKLMWLRETFLSRDESVKQYANDGLVDEAHPFTIHIALCRIAIDGDMTRTIGLRNHALRYGGRHFARAMATQVSCLA